MSGEKSRKYFTGWWRKLPMGAWGHGPLDNDDASDWKWEIGAAILSEISTRLESSDCSHQYHALGMWDFMRQRLCTLYHFFTTDDAAFMNEKCRVVAKKLYEDNKIAEQYSDPMEVRTYLAHWLEEICPEDEIKMGIIDSYVKDIEHLERVEVDFNSMGRGTKIKVTDGTCCNVYRIWLDNDIITVEDLAAEKFDFPFFIGNIADPESQKKFAEAIIKKHKLDKRHD